MSLLVSWIFEITLLLVSIIVVFPLSIYALWILYQARITISSASKQLFINLSLVVGVLSCIYLFIVPLELLTEILTNIIFHTFIFINSSILFHAILWSLLVRVWMIYFNINWNATLFVDSNGHWLQIRGISTKDRANPSTKAAARLSVEKSWWFKHRKTYGNQYFVIRNMFILFISFYMPMIILIYVMAGCYESTVQFVYVSDIASRFIPEICIIYLCYKMLKHSSNEHDPFYNTRKDEMMRIAVVVLVSMVTKFIVTVYYMMNGSRYGVVVVSMMEVCGIIYFQSYWLVNRIKIILQTLRFYNHVESHILSGSYHAVHDDIEKEEQQWISSGPEELKYIMHAILCRENLLDEFIHHLAAEFNTKLLYAFIEFTEFRKLLERDAIVMRSIEMMSNTNQIYPQFPYKSVILPGSIPRGSIVHNRKYSLYTPYNRYRKIVKKLYQKYIANKGEFELPINKHNKKEIEDWVYINCNDIVNPYVHNAADNEKLIRIAQGLYELFEQCREEMYRLMTQSCLRYVRSKEYQYVLVVGFMRNYCENCFIPRDIMFLLVKFYDPTLWFFPIS